MQKREGRRGREKGRKKKGQEQGRREKRDGSTKGRNE